MTRGSYVATQAPCCVLRPEWRPVVLQLNGADGGRIDYRDGLKLDRCGNLARCDVTERYGTSGKTTGTQRPFRRAKALYAPSW